MESPHRIRDEFTHRFHSTSVVNSRDDMIDGEDEDDIPSTHQLPLFVPLHSVSSSSPMSRSNRERMEDVNSIDLDISDHEVPSTTTSIRPVAQATRGGMKRPHSDVEESNNHAARSPMPLHTEVVSAAPIDIPIATASDTPIQPSIVTRAILSTRSTAAVSSVVPAGPSRMHLSSPSYQPHPAAPLDDDDHDADDWLPIRPSMRPIIPQFHAFPTSASDAAAAGSSSSYALSAPPDSDIVDLTDDTAPIDPLTMHRQLAAYYHDNTEDEEEDEEGDDDDDSDDNGSEDESSGEIDEFGQINNMGGGEQPRSKRRRMNHSYPSNIPYGAAPIMARVVPPPAASPLTLPPFPLRPQSGFLPPTNAPGPFRQPPAAVVGQSSGSSYISELHRMVAAFPPPPPITLHNNLPTMQTSGVYDPFGRLPVLRAEIDRLNEQAKILRQERQQMENVEQQSSTTGRSPSAANAYRPLIGSSNNTNMRRTPSSARTMQPTPSTSTTSYQAFAAAPTAAASSYHSAVASSSTSRATTAPSVRWLSTRLSAADFPLASSSSSSSAAASSSSSASQGQSNSRLMLVQFGTQAQFPVPGQPKIRWHDTPEVLEVSWSESVNRYAEPGILISGDSSGFAGFAVESDSSNGGAEFGVFHRYDLASDHREYCVRLAEVEQSPANVPSSISATNQSIHPDGYPVSNHPPPVAAGSTYHSSVSLNHSDTREQAASRAEAVRIAAGFSPTPSPIHPLPFPDDDLDLSQSQRPDRNHFHSRYHRLRRGGVDRGIEGFQQNSVPSPPHMRAVAAYPSAFGVLSSYMPAASAGTSNGGSFPYHRGGEYPVPAAAAAASSSSSSPNLMFPQSGYPGSVGSAYPPSHSYSRAPVPIGTTAVFDESMRRAMEQDFRNHFHHMPPPALHGDSRSWDEFMAHQHQMLEFEESPHWLMSQLDEQRRRQRELIEQIRAMDEPIGLTTTEIARFPISIVTEDESLQSIATDSSCCICLSTYDTGESVRRLPCLHISHSVCVDEWLKRSTTCPQCRHQLKEK